MFCKAFGLAEDVAMGSPLENSEGGLQYSFEGVHWELKGPPEGSIHHDTSKAFPQISFFLPNALLYYVKRKKQIDKLFFNGTLGSSVVNISSSRYKHWQC